MKYLMFLGFLLTSFSITAQIPEEYSPDQRRAIIERIELLKREYDIVLDPIEQMPIAPNARSLAEGNWGVQFTGFGALYDEVYKRAQRKVVVFILDTAGEFDHEFLKDAAWNEIGKTFTGEAPKDGHGHATHCAGIVGAVNGTQPLGIAKALVDKGLLKVVPIKVLNNSGAGNFSTVENALRYVEGQARALMGDSWFVVVSMSLGGPQAHEGTKVALKDLADLGVFTVAASGNNYNQSISYPGSDPSTFAIGAIGEDGKRANFSNYGEGLWKVEPGVRILSTYKDNSLAYLSGTSMATPLEAACAAITASIYPSYNSGAVRGALQATARDVGSLDWDEETGWGFTWAKSLLEFDGTPPDPDPDPEPEPEPIEKDKKRFVTMCIEGPIEVVYQSGMGEFRPLNLENIFIQTKSKELAETLIKSIVDETLEYFDNRAFVVGEKQDFLDASYFAGEFLEAHFKSELGDRIDVKSIFGVDANDSKGIGTKPNVFWPFSKKLNAQTFTY